MDRKQIRRAMGSTGWISLIYFLVMTGCVTVTMLVEMLISMIISLGSGSYQDMMSAMSAASTSAWGYFVAVAVGILILLLWKKPRYWKEEIWAKGRPMKAGDFFGILCIFLSVQIIYQVYVIVLELAFNAAGLSLMEGMAAMDIAGSDSLSMFLYAGVLAPVSEELLYRGLVQRTLLSFGKRITILGSAFLFGVMHGTLMQIPFAFLVGLVLGYVATEYSIAWAMLLHMINNLVLGVIMVRLTEPLGEEASALIIWGVLILAAIGAIVTLIRKRHEIGAWMYRNPRIPGYTGCFFGSAGIITFTIVMAVSTMITTAMMLVPL